MRPFENYGTKENPARISSAPMLLSCSGFVAMKIIELNMAGDESGEQARTGTAVGRAVELLHWGKPCRTAIETACAEDPTLTSQQIAHINRMVSRYADDPRNGKNSPLGSVVRETQETEVRVEISGVHFIGHPDQVRRLSDGRLQVWDLKAGKMHRGQYAVWNYAAQLALYSVALTETTGDPVLPGGIIDMQAYNRVRDPIPLCGEEPAFVFADWCYGDCLSLARCVAKAVKDVRRGGSVVPGGHCGFCFGGGFPFCQRLLEKLDA